MRTVEGDRSRLRGERDREGIEGRTFRGDKRAGNIRITVARTNTHAVVCTAEGVTLLVLDFLIGARHEPSSLPLSLPIYSEGTEKRTRHGHTHERPSVLRMPGCVLMLRGRCLSATRSLSCLRLHGPLLSPPPLPSNPSVASTRR